MKKTNNSVIELSRILRNWFYDVDLELDESGLDTFHDKSVVQEKADRLAMQLTETHIEDGTECWCNPKIIHVIPSKYNE